MITAATYYAIIAQATHAEHIRQADGDERNLYRIPHHILNPLQPNGEKSDAIAERLTHPHVHATFPAGGQFGSHQRGRHQENDRRNEIQQNGSETIIGHGRQRA